MELTGHPLRKWREDNSMTLVELATMAEITASHLSEVERGKNGMSLKLAAKISEITGISIDRLAEETPA